MASRQRPGDIGDAGESIALIFLLDHGLKLLERNFRCRQGELDLIMQDGDTLVFVEVRRRSQARFGSAAESITWSKQRRLLHAASVYLACRQNWHGAPMRFDVVTLQGPGQTISWLRNAITRN